MIKYLSTVCFVLASPLAAEESAAAPGFPLLEAQVAKPGPALFLPANTEVLLRMNQDISTKGRSWSEGDTFALTVVHDVIRSGYIIVPKGSRAIGRISWLTSKGAFGKSGKMDVELEYIEVGGQRLPINGTYRQEGEGNTVATVGGVVVAGLFAGFITGKSATIPQGRELMATTERDIGVSLPRKTTTFVANLLTD